MMRIVKLYQTCPACPSQWEGETDDGRSVYIRYRYGRLTMSVAAGGINAAVDAEPCVVVSHGDGLDGYLTTDVMCELIPDVEWPQ